VLANGRMRSNSATTPQRKELPRSRTSPVYNNVSVEEEKKMIVETTIDNVAVEIESEEDDFRGQSFKDESPSVERLPEHTQAEHHEAFEGTAPPARRGEN